MMNTTTRRILIGFCTILTVFALVAVTAVAQTSTTTKEVTGTKTATQQLNGTVVYSEGGTVAVKMSTGELRTFTPPADKMIKVDGQDVAARDLKVGTKLNATITTTTKSVTERTVTVGSGTVWFVNGLTVIVTMADGKNTMFKTVPGRKFNVEGQMVGVEGLKKGMKISGEKVVEEPMTEIAANTEVTGIAPKPKVVAAAPEPAPAPAPAPRPRRVVADAPAPVAPTPEASPAPAPAKLPKTGSPLPLAGLLGMLFTGAVLCLRKLR